MKEIKLKELRLENFKNFRSYTIKFNTERTIISGANGLGKSTILDAFCWCLFDKDRFDRKQFQLKTLENGKVIENIPHKVTAIIEVDSKEITIERVLREKWMKKRGEEVAEFTGNYEERYINDVPCNVSEFAQKIGEIIKEDEFKALINTTWFLSQDWQSQRAFLLKMSGDVSDEDVVKDSPEYAKIVSKLQSKGVTIEEYGRELKMKKKHIKEDSEGILPKIEQQQENIAKLHGDSTIDFKEIAKELESKTIELQELEQVIFDNNAPTEQWLNEIGDLSRKISAKEVEKINIESNIRKALNEKYNAVIKAKSEVEDKINQLQIKKTEVESSIQARQYSIEKRLQENEDLRKQFNEVAKKTLHISTDSFICPTCGREYEQDRIEEVKNQMLSNFNKDIARQKEEFNKKGKGNNVFIANNRIEVENLIKEKESLTKEICDLMVKLDNFKADKPDFMAEIEKNIEYHTICMEIEQLKLDQEVKALSEPKNDNDDLIKRKTDLSTEIDRLKAILIKEQQQKEFEQSIEELKERYNTTISEIAQIEKEELSIDGFAFAKIRAIEKKVNRLFERVQFKLFQTQINGSNAETCEVVLNGVPYSVLSNAQRIFAGVDIIKAISNYYQIKSPLFIDNSEALSSEVKADTQLILMRVTTDERLIIK